MSAGNDREQLSRQSLVAQAVGINPTARRYSKDAADAERLVAERDAYEEAHGEVAGLRSSILFWLRRGRDDRLIRHSLKEVRKMAAPLFQDIVKLLDTLVPIKIGAHGNFWQNVTRDQFVVKSIFGKKLIVGNDPNQSNLYLSLAGLPPFDGSENPQMPDTDSCPKCRHATVDELKIVSTWITNGAP